jgi:RimJ/RimL family protein N-acetyltransferase
LNSACGSASSAISGISISPRRRQSPSIGPYSQRVYPPWERVQHEGAIRFPDFRHFIVEAGEAWPSAGFVILQGCRNPRGSVELKRLVLLTKGRGYGRACVRLLVEMAFRDLGAHRFWLDVKEKNARALALYRDEGFVDEGRLRESVRSDAGYESLIVMSMLRAEHDARVEAHRLIAGAA